nr:hypothetical protein [Tanacetum cinerariifolium]
MKTEVPKLLAKYREGSAKRYKTSGSSSFNTEFGEANINLNADVGDDEEDEYEALAMLMVSETVMQNERAFEMKKRRTQSLLNNGRKVECRERELANQEYRQRQKDIRFYLQSYDHLIRRIWKN